MQPKPIIQPAPLAHRLWTRCRPLCVALLVLTTAGWPQSAQPTAAATGPVGTESVTETGLVIRQHGHAVPIAAIGADTVEVSLDRAPFALMFPRAVFIASDYQASGPNVRILISDDPSVFEYIRKPFFANRVGPAHAYAIPPAGEHYLMLTDVDFDDLLTAHNNMLEHRLDIAEADAVGITVEQIVDRNMADRLTTGPSPLYAVVLIFLELPSGEVVGPDAAPETLTPALIDYLVLRFPQ